MPAKRKLLPRPCPKCGSSFGTIQIVYLPAVRTKIIKKIDEEARKVIKKSVKISGSSRGFVIRIGHYVPEHYEEVKKSNDNPFNYASEEDKKKRLRTSQRRWCSFRSDHLEDDIGLRYRYDGITKPVTKQISAELWNEVIEEGWKVIPTKILSLT